MISTIITEMYYKPLVLPGGEISNLHVKIPDKILESYYFGSRNNQYCLDDMIRSLWNKNPTIARDLLHLRVLDERTRTKISFTKFLTSYALRLSYLILFFFIGFIVYLVTKNIYISLSPFLFSLFLTLIYFFCPSKISEENLYRLYVRSFRTPRFLAMMFQRSLL